MKPAGAAGWAPSGWGSLPSPGARSLAGSVLHLASPGACEDAKRHAGQRSLAADRLIQGREARAAPNAVLGELRSWSMVGCRGGPEADPKADVPMPCTAQNPASGLDFICQGAPEPRPAAADIVQGPVAARLDHALGARSPAATQHAVRLRDGLARKSGSYCSRNSDVRGLSWKTTTSTGSSPSFSTRIGEPSGSAIASPAENLRGSCPSTSIVRVPCAT